MKNTNNTSIVPTSTTSTTGATRAAEKKVTGERLKQLAISDSGFIFDPQTGQSFTVNKTGRVVIDMLKEDATIEAIATTLGSRYDKPYELTLCCVEALIMQLNRYL